MSWISHHRMSEELIAEAESKLRNGHVKECLAAYLRAAVFEELALQDLPPDKVRTFGITAVSVVSLYAKARSLEKAKLAATRYIARDNLPEFAKVSLRAFLSEPEAASQPAAHRA